MKRVIWLIGILFLATAILYYNASAQLTPEDNTWRAKVDSWVLQTADPDLVTAGEPLPQTEFLVYLKAQGDVDGADALAGKDAKATFVYDTLRTVANESQPAVVAELEANQLNYRRFWIVNMIWVEGDINAVRLMAQRDDVARIQANPTVPLDIVSTSEADMRRALESIEWNISLVDAPDVWAAGITGAGAVIGGQDTGYDWDHPGLINAYRGWDGNSADHDYNWHDSIHSGGGTCGANSPEPCDDHGHGTHTMGTMVGNDLDPADPDWPAGATNAVGMAPGAEWIGCRNMNVGDGTPASYTECYEFFIAPYPVGGNPLTDGDPTKAPHVINNSWSCPPSEGCAADTLQAVTQSVVAAGIVTVHSAGNEGPGCGTVEAPSATYDESFSVGATTSGDIAAGFSSRGPSTFDGGLKPDISAPGASIRSTTRGGNYGFSSGTSMAGPHVAGLVGLLVSADDAVGGMVDLLEDTIEQTAEALTATAPFCGGDDGDDVPNHVYGYGRINAAAAVGTLVTPTLTISKTASADLVFPGDLLTYTLSVDNTSLSVDVTNLVLTDVVPAETQLVDATMPYTFDGSTVQWDQATLSSADIWEVELTVVVDITSTAALITNAQYGVSSDETGTVAGTPVNTTVAPLDHQLTVAGTASPAVIHAGDDVTYTFSVSHTHPALGTTNVVLTDVIPAHSYFITATQPYTMAGGTIRWDTPLLAPVDSWEVELVVGTWQTATSSVLSNTTYAVSSDDVEPTFGPPLETAVLPTGYLHLPFALTE